MSFQARDNKIIVVGGDFIKFFDITQRCAIESRVVIGRLGHLQNFMCVSSLAGKPVVGTSNGKLYWLDTSKDMVDKVIDAHDHGKNCSVTAISSYGGGVITGSNDGTIKYWDCHGKEEYMVDLTVLDAIADSRVRSVSSDDEGLVLVVGTGGGDIIEITRLSKDSKDNATPIINILIQAHSKGINNNVREMRAIATHPNDFEYISGGSDCLLRRWSIRRRVLLQAIRLSQGIEGVIYNADGTEIAVSLQDGTVTIYNSLLTKAIVSFKHSTTKCPALRYSPDGKTLAVGSLDGKIYVYTVINSIYRHRAVCIGHRGGVRSLDFSVDSTIIQSNCTAGDLYYWDSASCEPLTPQSVSVAKWSTWSNIYGWPVQGLHSVNHNTDDIISLERSSEGTMLAVTDVHGDLKLSRFPVVSDTYVDKQYRGHAGSIARAAFSSNDRYILTAGREDLCILQWKCQMETLETHSTTEVHNTYIQITYRYKG